MDRGANLPKYKAEGTSRLHEFVDIGVVGTVSTRRAACHRCDHCWDFDHRSRCSNVSYVGPLMELQIRSETMPSAAMERMSRAQLAREAIELARTVPVGSIVCIETHKDDQTHPWVIGRVVEPMHNAHCASVPFDSEKDMIRFDPVKLNEPELILQLFEGLEPGSSTYFLSELSVHVPAHSVRVIDVVLEEARSSSRLQVCGTSRC